METYLIFYQNEEFYLDMMVNSMLMINRGFMSNNSSKDENVTSSEDSLISEVEFEVNPGIEEEFQEKDQEIKEYLPSAQQS